MRPWTRLAWALLAVRDHELRKVILFLQAENQLLRKRMPQRRIMLNRAERAQLVELGRTISAQVGHLITIVHPGTWQNWLRGTPPAQDKTPVDQKQDLLAVVLRLASETNWGYGRILGELKKLGYRVSESTVRNILKGAGIAPGPERGGTWQQFVAAQLDSLWQVDFFSQRIVTPTGLRQAFVLAFLHVGTRRVFCSPCSFRPEPEWMVERARECRRQAQAAGLAMTHLMHDRDGMFVRAFDEVFTVANCAVLKTAPRSPNQNAFIERWVKSITFEMLNGFIVWEQKHFDYLVSCYLSHYNEWRPHQGEVINNRPLTGTWPDVDEPLRSDEEIVCIESLGGILKRYERRAA